MYLIQYKHNMEITIVLLHPFMLDKYQSDKVMDDALQNINVFIPILNMK